MLQFYSRKVTCSLPSRKMTKAERCDDTFSGENLNFVFIRNLEK